MFKFRLQPVLKYREFLEEQRKMELADKQRIYLENKRRGEMLRDMRVKYHEAMRGEAAKEDVSVTRLSFYQSYIFLIEKQIAVQDEKTEEARIEMEKSQQRLVEAKKQKEVMLRARERAFAKYQYEEALNAQKALDDTASVKHIRVSRGLDSSAVATRIDIGA